MIFGAPAGLWFLYPVLFAELAFVVLVVVVVLVLRSDQLDRHGRRPYAVYLFSAIFVSLFVTLGGIAGIAEAVQGAPGNECMTYTSQGVIPVASLEGQTEPSPFPFPTFPSGIETVVPSPLPPPDERLPDFDDVPRPEFPSPFPFPTFPIEPGSPPVVDCPVREQDFATGLAVRSGLIALAGGAVLFFHADRARELLAKEASDDQS